MVDQELPLPPEVVSMATQQLQVQMAYPSSFMAALLSQTVESAKTFINSR
jgi:hypothetical protein